MKKNLLKLTLCLLSTTGLMAQNIVKRQCGTMQYLDEQIKNDPTIAVKMQKMETDLQVQINNMQSQKVATGAIVTIPTVVHVVYNTSAQNISNAQINSQFVVLNADYRKLNADISSVPNAFKSLIGDATIEFCLAKVDPNGNPTTGIIRKSTTSTSFILDDKVKHTSQGGDDAWDATKYLNIWVCNLGSGLLGYATFPGPVAAANDGVVIQYQGFGSGGSSTAPYDKGRTVTHEVGHWLNLHHIWGDANCGDDLVSDTPTQQANNSGCPTFPKTSCSNGTNGDMFMNYMDYTNDACMFMFSAGQATRMIATINGTRSALKTATGCNSGVTTCTPLSLPFTEGFEGTTFTPTGWKLNNPDDSITWVRTTTAAKKGSASAMIDNFNYSASGDRDDLVLPCLNLTTASNPKLTFQVAYKLYTDPSVSPNYSDTLSVLISTDNGITFTSLYKKWGAALTTTNPTWANASFVPLSSEWRLESIPLTAYSTKTSVIFKFVNSTHFENKLYIDDINISTPIGIDEIINNGLLSIYPNPNNGFFNCQVQGVTNVPLEIRITNVIGELVYETIEKKDGTYAIDLSNQASGIYMVKTTMGEVVSFKKILINK